MEQHNNHTYNRNRQQTIHHRRFRLFAVGIHPCHSGEEQKRHGRHHFVRKRRTPQPINSVQRVRRRAQMRGRRDESNPSNSEGDEKKVRQNITPISRLRTIDQQKRRQAGKRHCARRRKGRENSQRSSAESSVKHASNPFVHIPQNMLNALSIGTLRRRFRATPSRILDIR